MSNKYANKSKAMNHDKAILVSVINNIDFNFDGKIRSEKCRMCMHDCSDMYLLTHLDCENFSLRYSLNDLNEWIIEDNINLRRLCKNNKLNYGKMCDMLKNKRVLLYKYFLALEKRIMEKEYIVEHLDKEA